MPSDTVQILPASSTGDEISVPWTSVERFVGQLAHDIRNGLNACELQLTFLGEIVTDPDAVEEVKAVRATLGGITKQLQAVRLTTGAVTAHTLDYSAADLFEDFKERFARLHPSQAGRVMWYPSTNHDALICVDPELVLTSLLELLNNALHFAAAGSSIAATIDNGDGKVLISFGQTLAEAPATLPDDWGKVPLQSSRRGAYGLGLFRARRALAAQGADLRFHYDADQRILSTVVNLLTATSPAL